MFKTIRIALLGLLLIGGSAHAVSTNAGVDPVSKAFSQSFSGVTSFIDEYTFSLTGSSSVTLIATSQWDVPTAGLRALTFKLFDGAIVLASTSPSVVVPPTPTTKAFTLASYSGVLGAGSYRVELGGNVRPDGGNYIAVITSVGALPVPEASEWAMYIAGLGLLGMMVGRRRRASAAAT